MHLTVERLMDRDGSVREADRLLLLTPAALPETNDEVIEDFADLSRGGTELGFVSLEETAQQCLGLGESPRMKQGIDLVEGIDGRLLFRRCRLLGRRLRILCARRVDLKGEKREE
jgi:hypothetical protein